MKKEIYMQPKMLVRDMDIYSALLVGSIPLNNGQSDGGWQGSKENQEWDDEDDQE